MYIILFTKLCMNTIYGNSIENNTQYSDPVDPVYINNYFCEQSSIDDSNDASSPFEPFISTLNSVHISDTDVDDVLKLLDKNKACGPDLINPCLLEEAEPFFPQNCAIYLINH